jgi:RimJ/RimL family protein N-acetyltransferase
MSVSAELTMWLTPTVQRTGTARSVACAFVDWLFHCESVLRVYAGTYHPNRAAVGALFAAGFTLEARLRHAAVKDGQVRDAGWLARESRHVRRRLPVPAEEFERQVARVGLPVLSEAK